MSSHREYTCCCLFRKGSSQKGVGLRTMAHVSSVLATCNIYRGCIAGTDRTQMTWCCGVEDEKNERRRCNKVTNIMCHVIGICIVFHARQFYAHAWVAEY